MNNFYIIKLDKLQFNYQELVEYYNVLEKNFAHLKWTTDLIETSQQVDGVKYYTDGTIELPWYSWGIQTSQNPGNKIEGGWRAGTDPTKNSLEKYVTRSPLVFGIAKKLIVNIPTLCQLGIVVHPPGGRIVIHQDVEPEDQDLLTVQIPIVTNEHAYWINDNGKTVLETGSAYLLNTHLLHGTDNQGTSSRVHLLFRVSIDIANKLISDGVILD